VKNQDEVPEEKAAERIHNPQQNSGGYLKKKEVEEQP
jgi:hypothetical protein